MERLPKDDTIIIMVGSEDLDENVFNRARNFIHTLRYATRAWDSPLEGMDCTFTVKDLDRLEGELHVKYQKMLKQLHEARCRLKCKSHK